jgi:hypothetical protein
MRGGSQSILVRASDGHSYVVKSINNPQGRHSVINDLVATALAAEIGLPVAVTKIVEITEQFILQNCLQHEVGGQKSDWLSGLQFGAQTPVDPDRHPMFDYAPVNVLGLTSNIDAALGCWLFDAWTGNGDSAQAVFYRKKRGQRGARPYAFIKVDHGFCFGCDEWVCRDLRREPVFFQRIAMPLCTGLGDFEPYLSRIRDLSLNRILASASTVPKAWWKNQDEPSQFSEMLTRLYRRAGQLEIIAHTCWPSDLLRNSFPRATGLERDLLPDVVAASVRAREGPATKSTPP